MESQAKQALSAESKQKGIDHSLKVLDGLLVVVPVGVEIMADKELSMKDVKPVVEVVKKYETVVEAVKSADAELILEAKDYDTAELAIIGAKALEIVKASKEAYARGK